LKPQSKLNVGAFVDSVAPVTARSPDPKKVPAVATTAASKPTKPGVKSVTVRAPNSPAPIKTVSQQQAASSSSNIRSPARVTTSSTTASTRTRLSTPSKSPLKPQQQQQQQTSPKQQQQPVHFSTPLSFVSSGFFLLVHVLFLFVEFCSIGCEIIDYDISKGSTTTERSKMESGRFDNDLDTSSTTIEYDNDNNDNNKYNIHSFSAFLFFYLFSCCFVGSLSTNDQFKRSTSNRSFATIN
jgi:hypothetical protein